MSLPLRVIEGGGQPHQDQGWIDSSPDLEAMEIRNERERRIREERAAALENRWHSVYFMYDAAGALLYVGISANGPARFTQHSTTQPWWRSVHRVELEHVYGRRVAEERELELIRARKPKWNVAGVVE